MKRTSFDDGWAFRPKTSSFLELAGAGTPWTDIAVPHDAIIGTDRNPALGDAATGFHPGGVFEYRKTFSLSPEQQGPRVTLEFEGVYRGAMVYVNGHFAGQRPYGYSQFLVDVTHLLNAGGSNEVRVEATSHADSRWYTGAGIYRSVHLLVGDRLHVEPNGIVITTPDVSSSSATVVVETAVTSRDLTRTGGRLRTELVDPNGNVVARDELSLTLHLGTTVRARQRLHVADPQRWSVDSPQLYVCRTSVFAPATDPAADVLMDEEATCFGIRSLALDAVNGLRINDEPVLLRGTCIHHDNGVLGAATFPRAEERRIEILKDAGFNAVRSAHQPMSRAMLDACDRLGMLVMDESFDMWTSSKTDDDYAQHFPSWWEADVEAMVRKDVNHPSVVFYCIGNEIPEMGTAEGAAWARRMADKVRDLDDSRYVTCAVNGILAAGAELFAELGSGQTRSAGEGGGVNTMLSQMFQWMPFLMQQEIVGRKTAESFAALDVAGYNYLESRYEMDAKLYPNRVIVGTETWPGEIDRLWRQVKDLSHVLGDFTWTGWDYLGEAGVGRVGYEGDQEEADALGFLGGYPWRTAWVGDIDITGHRRPASYYREIVYGLRSQPFIAVQRPQHAGRPVVHKTPWAWSDSVDSWSWPGFEGRPVRVEVYADADEVELLLDGDSIDRAPAGESARFRAEFDTTYQPGELTAVAYRDGKEVGRSTLRTARGPVQLAAAADRSEVRGDGQDLAFVTISLVDDNATVHLGQDREVTVTVTGPAVLAGLGSGDPRSTENFTADRCSTFDGRALAVVRPLGPGPVEVVVSAPGCLPVRLTLAGL